jgi:alpha-beta hydrolase superfamily lysophospholipase
MNENTQAPERAVETAGAAYQRGRVMTSDQLELVWQSWTPASPRGAIVIVHGLAEHSGRYQETAEFFASRGWAAYACDLRAHGLSPNPCSGTPWVA